MNQTYEVTKRWIVSALNSIEAEKKTKVEIPDETTIVLIDKKVILNSNRNRK